MGVYLFPLSSPFSSSPPPPGNASTTRSPRQKEGRPRAAGCRQFSNGWTSSGTGRSLQGDPPPFTFFRLTSLSRRRRGVVGVLGGGADVKSEPFDVLDGGSELDGVVPEAVNMSIAILPMSAEFNWNPATVGLIQSSFFWGYLLTQIAGGIWENTVGGKHVLGFGVVWWSIATALTPIAAKIGLPFLLVVRAFMGIGEGVAMPAMNNILSKWVPVSERSRSLALVYSGMYLGSVTGLAFSPLFIHNFGWPGEDTRARVRFDPARVYRRRKPSAAVPTSLWLDDGY